MKSKRISRALWAGVITWLAGPPLGGLALAVLLMFYQALKLPGEFIASNFSPVVVFNWVELSFSMSVLFAAFSFFFGWPAASIAAAIFALFAFYQRQVTALHAALVGLLSGLGGIWIITSEGLELGVGSGDMTTMGLYVFSSIIAAMACHYILRRFVWYRDTTSKEGNEKAIGGGHE